MEEKDLINKVLLRVARVERRGRLAKAIGFGAALAGSLLLSFVGWFLAMDQASHSGFFAFTSLLFSDFSSAVANFNDFFLSLVESFPVVPAILLLSGIFFAIWSAARFLNEAMLMRKHPFSALH